MLNIRSTISNLNIRLPKCLVIAEAPVIARWDSNINQWRTSGIQLENFNQQDNLIVFNTSVFGIMAIFQDYHINMPFQTWELRPLPMWNNKIINNIRQPSTRITEFNCGILNPTLNAQISRSQSVFILQNQMYESRAEATSNEHLEDIIDDQTANNIMILGPIPTLGISEEMYFSELFESNQCLLTITGGLTEVRLHILGERISVLPGLTKCTSQLKSEAKLSQYDGELSGSELMDNPKHELTHLWGKWFTLDEFIEALQMSGVNLFPRKDSVCRVECLDKEYPGYSTRNGYYKSLAIMNPLTEQRLYEQMALLSPAMAFGWSRWNAGCRNQNTIVLTAVEHVNQENNIDEETWKVYTVSRKKVIELRMKEYDENFDDTPNPDQTFHADFYNMYRDIGSHDGKNLVRNIDLKYMKTVRKLLQVTRLVIFA